MRGKFITLEGIDGAGKSTHLATVVRFLRRRGVRVELTREPGGTALGEKLRRLVLGAGLGLHPETETLLMFAARREHLRKVIAPALAAGRWVVCDRFTDATYAYQAGGSGVRWSKVRALERWVQDGLQPDLTLLFDLSPSVARARAGSRGRRDRFEREKQPYFTRVRAAYRRRVREGRGRIRVVDSSAPISIVKNKLEEILVKFCKK